MESVLLRGEILNPCEKSGTIPRTIDDWKKWTKLDFPGSGSYVIPGALSPISIDIEKDERVCVEPNLWVLHKIKNNQIIITKEC